MASRHFSTVEPLAVLCQHADDPCCGINATCTHDGVMVIIVIIVGGRGSCDIADNLHPPCRGYGRRRRIRG